MIQFGTSMRMTGHKSTQITCHMTTPGRSDWSLISERYPLDISLVSREQRHPRLPRLPASKYNIPSLPPRLRGVCRTRRAREFGNISVPSLGLIITATSIWAKAAFSPLFFASTFTWSITSRNLKPLSLVGIILVAVLQTSCIWESRVLKTVASNQNRKKRGTGARCVNGRPNAWLLTTS